MTIHLIIEILIGTVLWDSMNFFQEIIGYFLIGITVVILAVPAGLPLGLTIVFAYFIRKMMTENNLVRLSSSWEFLGEVNNICSHQTGIFYFFKKFLIYVLKLNYLLIS